MVMAQLKLSAFSRESSWNQMAWALDPIGDWRLGLIFQKEFTFHVCSLRIKRLNGIFEKWDNEIDFPLSALRFRFSS